MAVTAQQIVDALQAAILANPATVSVTVDGQTVNYGTLEARNASLEFWEKRAAKAAGQRPRVASINLGVTR